MSQAKKSRASASQEISQLIEVLSREVARYMLYLDRTKQIIRRQDVVDKVVKPKTSVRGVASKVISRAARKIEDTFGLFVYSLDGSKIASGQRYIVCQGLSLSAIEGADIILGIEKSEHQYNAFLMIVIGILFMNKEPMKEDEMFKTLSMIGLSRTEPHPVFQKPSDTLDRMIRESYLVKEKSRDESQESIYQVGPRAKIEIPIAQLLVFIGKILGKDISPTERKEWETFWSDWKPGVRARSSETAPDEE